MKRFLTFLILTLFAFVLTGCMAGEKGTAKIENPSEPKSTGGSDKPLKIGIVFDKGGIDDKSFNASAWRGIERAQSEFGIEVEKLESREEKDYVGNLQLMVDKECDLVIGVGIAMQTAMQEVAAENAETKFAIVDALVEAENVRSLKFKEEEGSFLAGYLAGLMTKTNKIGFVGGMKIGLIEKFAAGYGAGAKASNPNVEFLPAKYTGDWNNVDVGKQSANTLYMGGADIVFAAAGKAGLGVLNAAKENKKFAIGVDSDQDDIAEGFVLTSMIKRVDEAVYLTIKDMKEGKFSAGETIYDLKSNGVGLSEMRFTKELIGAEKLAKVDEAKAMILDGKVTIPTNMAELEKFTAPK